MDTDEDSNVLKILQNYYQGEREGGGGVNYRQKS